MSEPKKENNFKAYAAYSSLAIQMGLIITAGAYFGQWLDERLNVAPPTFTIAASLLAVFGSMYKMFKHITKKNNNG